MTAPVIPTKTFRFRVGHFFCGLGAGARGFKDGGVRFENARAEWITVGGIDNDAEACADFEMITGAPSLCADMHEIQPAQIRKLMGEEAPDCIFTSPPCKGLSGLLGNDASASPKYQKLNSLVFKGLHLMCETWPSPPPLIVLENVPRITSRGAELLEKARGLLRRYGYVFHESTHDCGEIGGLAQHRRRFLLVARLPTKVPNFVYQPPKKRVRGCGEVLGGLPLPQMEEGGPMHRLPSIEFLTWVRLAMIPAGGDWRDLPRKDDPDALKRLLALKSQSRPNLYGVVDWNEPSKSVTGSASVTSSNGVAAVADPRTWGGGSLGITGWDKPTGAVCGESLPRNGRFSIADPRLAAATAVNARGGKRFADQYQVAGWEDAAPTVTGNTDIQAGAPSVVDPRLVEKLELSDRPNRHRNKYGVAGWDQPAPAVIGATRPNSGAASVVDPRLAAELSSPLKKGEKRRTSWSRWDVRGWGHASRVVAGDGTNGAFAVVDPRELALGCTPRGNSKGPYGVMSWQQAAATVTGSAAVDNTAAAVADPRRPPEIIPVIVSPHDGHWHRPITTYELAALQDLPTIIKGKPLQLAGRSSQGWRERIGNAVPRASAQAIGEAMLFALLTSALGTWTLGGTPIWVQGIDGNEEIWAP